MVTKVHGIQKERRYVHDSELTHLIAVRANWVVERATEPTEPKAPYWDACREYLKTIPGKTKRHANAYNDLHCWRQTFTGLNVKQITAALIQAQLATWVPDFKPSTLNKRRQELKNLFDFLRLQPNPISTVSKLKERYDDARAVSPAVAEAVLAQMNETQTKIVLRAIYETSLPPIDLTRIQEAHFRPRQHTQFVPERQKGAGAPALTMTLTRAGVKALQAFYAAGLEGKVISSGTIWRDFDKAVQKAKAVWKGVWPAPANLRPYDLRHSRLTEALRRSGNLQGVQQLARHKHIETTMRYLKALESDSLRAVTDSMNGASRKVPSGNVKKGQNRPKRTAGANTGKPRK